ncbi:endonuclease [Bacillus sp. Marseille-Q3570]|uniref:endonuclease n=1 Tax=Bacillus sp. Marseille-Q3570 TaxID=2963522 RepID=UPI0021B847CF|nr:endonuclease [Bacillus sp. Marseille-Q3570]
MSEIDTIEMLNNILPKNIIEMLTGKLLGDGNITIEKGKRGRLRFTHASSDKEWCKYCYDMLKEHLPFNAPKYRKLIDPRMKQGFTECYYVQSKTAESIDFLKALWYPSGKKQLPKEFIRKNLSPLSLAWWYMDDGNLKVQNNNATKVILSTDSFSNNEVNFLQEVLFSSFQLTFKTDKQNRLLLYDKASIFYFLSIVKPHLIPSMGRKYFQPIPASQNKPQRTTIYLPHEIILNKPTKQINNVITRSPPLLLKLDSDIYRKQFYVKYQNLINARRGYQIIITSSNQNLLNTLQLKTGFEKSICAQACFDYISENGRLK